MGPYSGKADDSASTTEPLRPRRSWPSPRGRLRSELGRNVFADVGYGSWSWGLQREDYLPASAWAYRQHRERLQSSCTRLPTSPGPVDLTRIPKTSFHSARTTMSASAVVLVSGSEGSDPFNCGRHRLRVAPGPVRAR